MWFLLLLTIGSFFAFAIYLASLSVKHFRDPSDFLNANQGLPPWVFLFAVTGVTLAGHGLYTHFVLVSKFGFQFNHVAIGLVIVSMVSILFMQRLWLASRLSGLKTAGDVLAGYYSSHSIRIYLFVLLLLFAVPFTAMGLIHIGALLEAITDGAMDRNFAIWGVGFFLFLYACIGGWRTVAFVATAQTTILLTLLILFGAYSFAEFGSMRAIMKTITVTTGSAQQAEVAFLSIPGVIQFTNGLGKEAAAGGGWTTAAILSYGLALTGIVLSPAVCFLAITSKTPRGFAFQQVWMTGGLAAGLLLLIAPLIGMALYGAGGASVDNGQVEGLYVALVGQMADFDRLLAVAFVFMLLLSLKIAVAFFALAGANIFALEIFGRYINPDASGETVKLCARVTLAVIFFVMTLIASFAPAVFAHLFGGLALSLATQLIPAFMGLCWLPWISRQGVLVGLIIGMILVVFTEPLGIVLFEMAFVDLPWGRWPWTVHSAGWGLVFNMASCLLVSGFTRNAAGRSHRDGLHAAFARDHGVLQGRRRMRTALWSLTLIWVFLAIGPGAILGNNIFSLPVLTDQVAEADMPSIWVWQVVFWFLGVTILWWMAYQSRFSVLSTHPIRSVELIAENSLVTQTRIPNWIGLFLARFAARDGGK